MCPALSEQTKMRPAFMQPSCQEEAGIMRYTFTSDKQMYYCRLKAHFGSKYKRLAEHLTGTGLGWLP